MQPVFFFFLIPNLNRDSVIPTRYRDHESVIRKQTLDSYGSWLLTYPSFFLRDDYLKYAAWMLNDAVAIKASTSLRTLHSVDFFFRFPSLCVCLQ